MSVANIMKAHVALAAQYDEALRERDEARAVLNRVRKLRVFTPLEVLHNTTLGPGTFVVLWDDLMRVLDGEAE